MDFIRNEPAFFYGLIQALVAAGLNLVIAFGLALSADQVAAVNGAVWVVAALVLSLVTRSKVTPTSKL